MVITVKKATLWRRETEQHRGALAGALKPFADSDVNLQVVMAYRFPAPEGRFACEVYPVTDEKSEAAARKAGLEPSKDVYCLIVEGDDQTGLGYSVSSALVRAEIELHFAMAFVVEQKFTGVFGFGSDGDAARAADVIRCAHVESETPNSNDFSPCSTPQNASSDVVRP